MMPAPEMDHMRAGVQTSHMPPRTLPSYRRARLGAELRRMRLNAGVSAELAASLVGMDRGKIPSIEAGARTLSAERLRTLVTSYGCTDEPYIDALLGMAQRRRRGWWDQYRERLAPGFLDIAELEWHATRMHTVQAVHVPGLLQTEEYSRAVFNAVLPQLSRLDVELRVAHRQERQVVLDRRDPVRYTGYVHEAALRMQFGGRQVSKRQLDRICERSTAEHITIRVIPVSQGAFPGAGHPLFYAEESVPQLDTAQLDSAHGPEFLHGAEQLAKYRSHLAWMSDHTLSPEASRDLIRDISKEL
ncbi:helix-turn-helix domain-containing protein [Streptomyces sp. NPDC058874]|uniref:helix-turn-helix domain-containing protein n=2 Tax=Streptomyces TaxID=1883 RepID=UPI0036BFCE3F